MADRPTNPRIVLPARPGRRARTVLAGTLGVTILLMSAQARRSAGGPTILESAGLFLMTPLTEASRLLSAGIRNGAESVGSYLSARRENRRLRAEAAASAREIFELRAQAREAERLRGLMRGTSFLPQVRLESPILSVISQGAYRRILLGAGALDGVAAMSPLAVPEGLVGRVVFVSPHLSKAISVTDSDCAVGGRVLRSGDIGVLRGDGGDLTFDYVSTLSTLAVGDMVETAGNDGIFPAGIPVGRVISVSRGRALFLTVHLAPSAPLSRLTHVLVLNPSPAAGLLP
jgi:rod shape-determining protein MreC